MSVGRALLAMLLSVAFGFGLMIAVSVDAAQSPASGASAEVPQTPSSVQDLPTEEVAEEPPADAEPAAPSSQTSLQVQREIDGDSFVASDGIEYRVGLINTPEYNQCGGSEASRAAYELLAGGFTTEGYATDNYGRTVARITLVDGRDLGETLALDGWADDRYLEQFRHENESYAAALDVAFAQASPGGGVASICQVAQLPLISTPDPQPVPEPATPTAQPEQPDQPVQPLLGTAEPETSDAATGCHPDYVECIPITSDLDCADIGHQVNLTGNGDSYQLDGRSFRRENGLGCESYPPL